MGEESKPVHDVIRLLMATAERLADASSTFGGAHLALIVLPVASMARAPEPQELIRARAQMVEHQLRARGVVDSKVLEAMLGVPRQEFVPQRNRASAYDDRPLSIGGGQTISQPYMVATMLAALQLRAQEKVLDVGTGSGYQAALLSLLAREVVSIEIVPKLARNAQMTLRRLGHSNVRVVVGDGSVGWPEGAPYDAIVVAAGSPRVPAPLLAQLADGGRLVIPVGESTSQRLLRVRKRNRGFETEELMWCEFVPLVGQEGWADRVFA
jgi:protein-L-isoaspartate(D-aspartate) O-methyltransferase